jgi:DNA invertase Pin-like site-specific DNA recombinase
MKQPLDNNIKYFLYARKSSESEDRQIQSIGDQIDRLTQLAKSNGWVIKEVLTEAHSAKQPNARPIFNSMLDRIERGEANGILCWQINRLSRNPVDSAKVQWLLLEVIIQSIQTIDGERKPTDNVVLLSVEASVANQFILDHIKNVRRGMESKLAKGWLPACPPIGYLNDPITRTIIPDQERFLLIRRLLQLVLTKQYSIKEVAHLAAGWGLVSRKTKHKGGKALSKSAVYNLLTNPFYCGIIKFSGNYYQGNHKPAISVKEYDLIQTLLGRPHISRHRKYDFTYRGIFRCGECGCILTGDRKRKFIKSIGVFREYTYYYCTKSKATVQCSQRGCIREEEITSQIIDILGRYTISQELFSVAKQEILSSLANENILGKKKLQSAQLALKSLESQLTNLTGMRYRELIDDNQYLHEKAKLAQEKVRLDLTIQQYGEMTEPDYDQILLAFTYSANAQKAFITGSVEARRNIVRGLSSNPTALNKKLNIEAAEWLIPLKSDQYPSMAESEIIELTKNPLNSVQEDTFVYNFPLGSTLVNVIRTILGDPSKEFYIPCLDETVNTRYENFGKAA